MATEQHDIVPSRRRFLRTPAWTPLSPWKHLAITTTAIFCSEIAAMSIVGTMKGIPFPLLMLADAAIMTVLVFPILYALSFRPLLEDISQRRRTEAALRRSNTEHLRVEKERETHLRRLEVLIEASHRILAETTLDGVLRRVTDEGKAITGARTGLIGRVAATGEPTGGLPPCLGHLTAPQPGTTFAIARGGPVMEALSRRPSIRLTDDELHAHPVWQNLVLDRRTLRGLLGARLVAQDGAPCGMVMLSDRVSGDFSAEDEAMLAPLAALASLALQHLQARTQAQEKADELDAVFNAMVEPVVISDGRGTLQRANPAAVAALGLDPTGRRLPEALERLSARHHDGDELVSGEFPIARALAGETVVGQRIRFTAASGEDAVIVATASPLRTSGLVSGAVTVWHDITERVKAEVELRAAHDALEARVLDRTRELARANAELRDEIADRMESERHKGVTRALLELFALKTSRQEYLDAVVELVREWTAVRCVGVRLRDARGGISFEAHVGFEQGFLDSSCQPPEQPGCPCSRVILGAPDSRDLPIMTAAGSLHCADIAAFRDSLSPEERALYTGSCLSPHFGSVAIVPIRYRGHILGAVQLADQRNDAVSPVTLAFIESIVPLIGEAVQRFNLEEELRRFAREQSVLYAVATAATSFLDPTNLLDAVLEVVLPALDTDAGWVSLPGPTEDDPPHIAVSYGVPKEFLAAEESSRFTTCPTCGPLLCGGAVANAPQLVAECPRLSPDVLGASGIHSHVSVPLNAGGDLLGILNVAWREPHPYTPEERAMLRAVGDLVGVALANARLFTQARTERERLQVLSRQLVEVQETERMVVARELHDDAGQTLTALMVGLRLLEREAGDPLAVTARVAELKRTADGVLENLHRLASNLRPASLDHLGLVATLRQDAQSLNSAGGLTVRFEARGFDSPRLPPAVETALYRIAQEAMTNAIRHAKASRVEVLLDRRDDGIIIAIEDDGTGFDLEAAARGRRLGLVGMKERVEMLGGKLHLRTAPGSGTAVIVEVPNADSHPDSR